MVKTIKIITNENLSKILKSAYKDVLKIPYMKKQAFLNHFAKNDEYNETYKKLTREQKDKYIFKSNAAFNKLLSKLSEKDKEVLLKTLFKKVKMSSAVKERLKSGFPKEKIVSRVAIFSLESPFSKSIFK